MTDEVECPYCSFTNEIDLTDCHETGIKHETECGNCDKTFVFELEYDPILTASKADCLNGEEHDLIIQHNVGYDVSQCNNCNYRHIKKVEK